MSEQFPLSDELPLGSKPLPTIEQLQAQVERCQAQLMAAEREGQLKAEMLQKLCEALREPIANITMAARMLEQTVSERDRDRYTSILRAECLRQLEILNHINRMQSSGAFEGRTGSQRC